MPLVSMVVVCLFTRHDAEQGRNGKKKGADVIAKWERLSGGPEQSGAASNERQQKREKGNIVTTGQGKRLVAYTQR